MSGANIAPASAEDRGARSLDDMDFNDVFDGNRSPGTAHNNINAAAREVRPDSPEPRRTRQSAERARPVSRRTSATRFSLRAPRSLPGFSQAARTAHDEPHQRHAWPHRRASARPRRVSADPRDPRGATPGRRGAAIGPRVSSP